MYGLSAIETLMILVSSPSRLCSHGSIFSDQSHWQTPPDCPGGGSKVAAIRTKTRLPALNRIAALVVDRPRRRLVVVHLVDRGAGELVASLLAALQYAAPALVPDHLPVGRRPHLRDLGLRDERHDARGALVELRHDVLA